MGKEEFLKKYELCTIETPNNYDVKVVYEIAEFFYLNCYNSKDYSKVYINDTDGVKEPVQMFHVEQFICDTLEVLKTEREEALFNTVMGVGLERTIQINDLLNKIEEWYRHGKQLHTADEKKQPLFEVGTEVRSSFYMTDKEGNKHMLRKADGLNLWRVEGSPALYEMEGNKIKNIYYMYQESK